MIKSVLKAVSILLIFMAIIVLIYRLVFIRTVNYEIAGLKIPSRYNLLTGSIKPITDYKGTSKLPTMEVSQSKDIGLSDEEVAIARLRWTLFEQWVNSRSEFKGWESDQDIFKKANEEFKKALKAHGPNIAVAK